MSAEGRNALSEKIPLSRSVRVLGQGQVHQLEQSFKKSLTTDQQAGTQLNRKIPDPMPNETVRMEQSWMLVLLRALLSRH